MTRKNKLIILVFYLLLLSAVMLAYRNNRTKKVRKLRASLEQIDMENERTRKGQEELARLIKCVPLTANNTAVVESLYRYAKESGLERHEIATSADNQQKSARPGGSTESEVVAINRIKIDVAGSFRQIAEYIRRIQNMERSNRITEIKLTTDKSTVKGAVAIEFYSLAAVKP